MKTRRNTGGFTLLELMLAVAVIGILSAVVAVNVVHYQRTLTQVELDGIAREIFVAAQNHLTMAESQGFMGIDPKSDSDWGKTYQKGTPTEPAIYYYVVKPDTNTDRDSLNMLNLMLPFASVDETVRTVDGSYVIRYQKDPALVLDVFYAVAEETAEGDVKNRKFAHTFTLDEATPPKEDEGRNIYDTLWGYSGSAQKGARGQYLGTAVIGWYGVDPEWFSVQSGGEIPTPVSKGAPLSPPTVKVVNAEQLYVEVTNPNYVDGENPKTLEWYGNARLRLEITGQQSGNSLPIELITKAGFTSEKDYIIPDDQFYPKTYRVILDDVTQDGTRFHKIIADAGLFPGEDIIIRAVSYNNTELTNIATSANAETNSLFASVNGSTADIANFRHLENLDSAVSHINFDPDNVHITQANQTSDMDWDKFMSGNVSVYYGNTHTQPGEYFPVTNGGKIKDDGTIEYDKQITYNGNGHTISNVKINVSGNAGLFATLGHSSTVTDLELVNFDVKSSGGNAGALAGVLEILQDNSKVQGVLVHHDTPDISPNLPDEKKTVQGKSSTGGLIGEIVLGAIPAGETPGVCTIEQSAAAVYVTSSNGDAGGLIGTVSGGASARVMDSYAGGHVITKKDAEDKAIGVEYDKGNNNVTAKENAGGLIGSSAGSLTVKNCYATTSVDGGKTAGGLIGKATDGTIQNCYVTGYITGESSSYKGAFAGRVSKSTKFPNDDNRYLSIINAGLPNVGFCEDGSPANVKAFDTLLTDYVPYAPCTSGAVPYDPTLTQYYGGKYLFQTISQLNKSGTYTAEWMTKHYGDWPMPEKQVINVKSGGA
ncbi:MAG: type II secretion system protein [Oscillibacter sp.]|nr:type II secretion system protein [Oscillibacter sp.]